MVFTPAQPFAVQSGDGTLLTTPTGDRVVIRAGTEQTKGSLAVMELVIAGRSGPALHRHHHEDELWFVLDGDFRFKAGGQLFRASTGGMAFGPRGTPHCFQNVGDRPGRLLIVTTPAGLEGFFVDFADSPDADVLGDIGRAHGIDFLGPPLDVSDPL
jgi:mannose-6-phosphate isomerase-like protein (cupin superfamily)